MSTGADHAEVQRLRDRVHSLYSAQAAMVLRVSALEQWQRDHTREAERIYRRVDRLALDSDTAKAVAKALKGRQHVELTWFQRFAGVVIFVVSVADFVQRARGH